jgi:hypothetical protein
MPQVRIGYFPPCYRYIAIRPLKGGIDQTWKAAEHFAAFQHVFQVSSPCPDRRADFYSDAYECDAPSPC